MNVVRTAVRIPSLVALGMAFLLLVTACGSEPAPTTTEPEPELSLEEILARTGENLASFSTATFQMIDENETGAKFFGATLKNVDGEVESPDSAHIVVEVESAMGFAEIEIVAVGDVAFMKFSAGAPWNPLPLDQVPFNFVGLGITLSNLLPLVQDAAITGQEESLGGGPAIRVDGTLMSEDLSTLITSADTGHPIDLSLWIGEADHELRQIRISGQIFDDDGEGTSRLIILSDYNTPVDIQLPDTSS